MEARCSATASASADFVGLMLIERLVLHENKPRRSVRTEGSEGERLEPELRRNLSHIGGVGGTADFSNLTVFSHTDLSRPGDFPERFSRITELADVVIIDEAHHFRNPGKFPTRMIRTRARAITASTT